MSSASPLHKKAKQKSPHDLYFDELQAFLKKNNGIGNMLVRGIDDGEVDEEDYASEQEEDTSKYTAEQMKGLRFIVITQERADALEEMDQLILGDQYGQSCIMFRTSFSYHVLGTWEIYETTTP